MSKKVRVQQPSSEMLAQLHRARIAVATQEQRELKCPYCLHNAITVYEDTRGHVESKCKKCGRVTVFNVLTMRRTKRYRYPNQ